jgi:protein gp37
MGQERYRNAFDLTLHEDLIELPLRWRKPRVIFVNSMSDLFHRRIPGEFIERCFTVMQRAEQHVFQVLTKRPQRAAKMADELPWSSNIWMGTSVENERYSHRVNILQTVPAVVRFLSLEPLLGPIHDLPLEGIHWVIAGGESGPRARPMRPEWVRQIRNQCVEAQVPFFFKQWGAFDQHGIRRSKKANGRELDGRLWDQMPCVKTNCSSRDLNR